MAEYSVVGKRLPRVDAPAKATGAAQYAADLRLPGLLTGRILRSPHPHARILNIDTTRAAGLAGVRAVLTGRDTLGAKLGNWRLFPELLDEEGLASDKVRFVGDAVAAVAAVDADVAEEALKLIKVDYEVLPAVFTIEEALAEGAPLVHDKFERNISVVRDIIIGDVERGFRESDYVREDEFSTQAVQHCSMEPHVCVASFDPAGKLTVWLSSQAPYIAQCLLAKGMGLRENDVRVIMPEVGGGFGAKMELFSTEFCACLLSMKTGNPVRVEYTRHEEFVATRRRHPEVIRVKTGVKRDGTLVARESNIILEGGAYHAMGPTVTLCSGIFSLLPYRIPNFRFHGTRVFTNNLPSGAMRGLGGPQPNFAVESQLDLISKELGIDPVELRLKNAMRLGDTVPEFVPQLASCGFTECITRVAEASGWKKIRKRPEEGQGIGISCYMWSSGGLFNWFNTSLPFSEATVRLNNDGTVNLYTRAADCGQGSSTVLSQILAEELGLSLKDVKITAGDTETTSADMGAWSSRITFQAGNAVKKAGAEVKRQIFEVARQKLEARIHEDLEARDGKIFIKERPNKIMSLADAVVAAQRSRGSPVIGHGDYTPRGKGLFSAAFSFGAQAAEVRVDKETGRTRVVKLTTAHDCGQPINPMQVEGQLHGSAHMSLGMALHEEMRFSNGKVMNPSFRDYHMLRSTDMPDMEAIEVITFEPEGPFGAKEAGEGLTAPTGGAVANAVLHATGLVFHSLPITSEKVCSALSVSDSTVTASKRKKTENAVGKRAVQEKEGN